jgi:2,3-diketo-5-methylthio-1-phosphopentane phosphatase
MKHVVFCDFDGTITVQDSIDAMYDAFGPSDWLTIAKRLRAEGLRSRRIIKTMLGMLDASREQIVRLLRTLRVREGFPEFRRFCRRSGADLVIMSEGICLSVETVLHERGIDDLPYFGNVLVRGEDGKWTTLNPHQSAECDDCGNCKSAHLVERKKKGEAVIYVGDGPTDRCPALVADFVFAVNSLADFCDSAGIPYLRFESFSEVVREMSREDFTRRLEAEASRDLERKTTLPKPNRAARIRTPRDLSGKTT